MKQVLLIAHIFVCSLTLHAYKSNENDLCLNSLVDRSLFSLGVSRGKPIVPISDLISKKYKLAQRVRLLEGQFRAIGATSWHDAVFPVARLQKGTSTHSFLDVNSMSSKELHPDVSRREYMSSGVGFFQNLVLKRVCSEISKTLSNRCAMGVRYLLTYALGQNSHWSEIVYEDRWVKNLARSGFRKGLVHAANLVSEQYRSKSVTDANLLHTFFRGFLKFSSSRTLALNYAWDAMMMFANGAQNTNRRVGLVIAAHDFPDFEILWDAVKTLSYAMGDFDFNDYKLATNSYSFPEEISGHCLTTKPYHFWMAAYQVRDLMKNGFTDSEAIMAVLTYAKGYQVLSVSSVRSGLALIFEKPWNHPTVSVIRHDLILNILGAYYGAGLLNNKQVNIESIFEKVFAARNQTMGNLNFKTTAKWKAAFLPSAYSYWSRMIDPNGILKIVDSEVLKGNGKF